MQQNNTEFFCHLHGQVFKGGEYCKKCLRWYAVIWCVVGFILGAAIIVVITLLQ